MIKTSIKKAAPGCISLLLLASHMLQPASAAVETLDGQYRVMAIDTGLENVIITVAPDFQDNQNCPTLTRNQLKLAGSAYATKELQDSVFAAAASGKTIGFILDGCDNIPLAQGLALQLNSNKPTESQGYRSIGQSTSSSTDAGTDNSEPDVQESSSSSTSDSDTNSSPSTPPNSPPPIKADGHEFAATKPTLSSPGTFSEEDQDFNKVWIGKPTVDNGQIYIATLTLDSIEIPAGKAIAEAQLLWHVSGQQSAYKLVNFEIRAVLNQATPTLGTTYLPSAQTLTNSSSLVKTQDWAAAQPTSTWTPEIEPIDITSVIQEATSDPSWVNNGEIQLVMTPVAYPAGRGFVAFNSGESGKSSPTISYSLADIPEPQDSGTENSNPTDTENTTGTEDSNDSNTQNESTTSSETDASNNSTTESGSGGSNENTTENTGDSSSIPEVDNTPLEVNWVTWRASVLPDVVFNPEAPEHGYSVELLSNEDNKTLHFNSSQGRFDGRSAEFPFEAIARNIGIEAIDTPGVMPAATSVPYIFAGIQVHVEEPDDPTSAHVVVGHRGATYSTIEGKNTVSGNSKVDDAGIYAVPNGRADIRIVGNADRTLTVYWQAPNISGNPGNDNWILYNGDGTLTGSAPNFDARVYIGLITYAYLQKGVPFRGVADSFFVDQLPRQ